MAGNEQKIEYVTALQCAAVHAQSTIKMNHLQSTCDRIETKVDTQNGRLGKLERWQSFVLGATAMTMFISSIAASLVVFHIWWNEPQRKGTEYESINYPDDHRLVSYTDRVRVVDQQLSIAGAVTCCLPSDQRW